MALWRPPRPTINRSHPAARGLQFSFAAQGSLAAFDLLKRQQGTLVGSPTAVTTARIGQALHFGSLTTDRFTFSDRPTVGSPATIAVIVVPNSAAGSSRCYFQSSSAANGIGLYNQTAGSVQLLARGILAYNPTIPLTASVPYLIVGSIAANNTVNMMTVRLDTGAVATATATNASAPTAGNGTFLLGNFDTGGGGCDADVAACLFSNTYLQLGTLTEWARDPWGPWQPELIHPEIWTNSSNVDEALHLADSNETTGPYYSSVAEAMSFSDAPESSSLRAARLAAEVLVTDTAAMQVSRVAAEVLVDATGVGEAVALADSAAASGSTLTGSVDETFSLTDAELAALAFTVAETMSLLDVELAGYPVSVDEAIALSDVASATVTVAVAEAIALSDDTDAVVLYTVAEAVALTDAESNIGTFGVSDDESLPLVDHPSNTAIVFSSAAEVLTLSDVEDEAFGDFGRVTEVMSLADAASVTAVHHGVDVFEVVNLLELIVTNGGSYSVSVAEAMALTSATASGKFSASVAETMALSDQPDVGGTTFAPAVNETISLADAESTPTSSATSVNEAISLSDGESTQHSVPSGNAAVSVIAG